MYDQNPTKRRETGTEEIIAENFSTNNEIYQTIDPRTST